PNDNKILVGGGFNSYNGNTRNYVVRLSPAGTVDASFGFATGLDSTVNALIVQPDGKVLLGGQFGSYNNGGGKKLTRSRVLRLNSDGKLDLSFDPNVSFNGSVNALVLQTDGQILVGGSFSSINGGSRSGLVRLSSNGTMDVSFNNGNAGTSVNALALQ